MADQGTAGAAASAAARQLAAEAREVIAGAAGKRVVVLGSLPPEGRDLDLLVSAETRPRLERALSAAGFTARASLHVRFASCTAYAVELIDSGGFLPPEALAELYESAIPLDVDGPLVRPAPPHALLILARLVDHEGRLSAKRARRLARIEGEMPDVWAAAQARARTWQAEAALARLQSAAMAGSRRAPRELARQGARSSRRALGRIRERARHGPPLLVSCSGIDGSGKSSQARWLHDALTQIGVDCEVIWNDLLGNAAVDAIARPGKAVLRALRRDVRQMADYQSAAPRERSGRDGGDEGGARDAWAAYVTVTNGVEQRVRTAHRRLRGQAVIFDRGPLDLAVRMSALYGTEPERLARLVRRTAPKPDLAFFLDIPPELSVSRKDDVWSVDQLAHHAELYRSLAQWFSVRRLDGTRPPQDIAAEIAQAAWLRLTS